MAVDRSAGRVGSGLVRGRTNHFHPKSLNQMGEFLAMNVKTGEPLWRQRRRSPYNTAALTTAGGLVFVGDWERYVFAYDAATGEQLWQTRLPTMTNGFPITYAVAGKQYVAVDAGLSVGSSSWATTMPADLLPEKQNPRAGAGNGIFVFALP